MILITYSETRQDNLQDRLGKADYSYYLLLERYLPALEALGTVIAIRDPASDIDPILREHPGEPCVFLSFTQPHRTYRHPVCPTVCMFTWEWSSIPDGSRESPAPFDWVQSLNAIGNTVATATHTTDLLRDKLAQHVNIAAIPAPVATVAEVAAGRPLFEQSLLLPADFYDSADLVPAAGADAPEDAGAPVDRPDWDDAPLQIAFTDANADAAKLLVGFYAAEAWGVWSRTSTPQIYLPVALSGPVEIEMELIAYGENIGRNIHVAVGESGSDIVLSQEPQTYSARFDVGPGDNALGFSNLDLASAPGRDYRTLGVGVKS
ncbi:MAG: hypothetical protein R3228_18780, partial [Halioglobus sp.]|nr:hypothetical protein [Halioglobus sp.]